MPAAPLSNASARRGLLDLVRQVPVGRVVTIDQLARHFDLLSPLVTTLLAQLTEDERQSVPWHRVVAKGGAIGRGPHRDRQFAALLREGVLVSPAGVVQDMARVALPSLDEAALIKEAARQRTGTDAATLTSKSRGMFAKPANKLT